MNYSIFVKILNSRENLMHKANSLFLINSFLLNNIIKEFSTICKLHNQINILFCFNYLNESNFTSYSWMILGCLSTFRIHISLVTLCISASSTILSFSNIFTATFSSVAICVPNLTLPNVPSPNVFPILRPNYLFYNSLVSFPHCFLFDSFYF